MSKNLVIGSYDEISSLIHKSADTIVVRSRVEPATEEEKTVDGQLNLLSCMTLHHFDKESGVLKVVQLQLTEPDEEGNETNQGRVFCSFGGQLDTDDCLVEGVVPDEEGNVSYTFTLEQFLQAVTAKSKQAAESVLGVTLDLTVTPDNTVVFQTGRTATQDPNLVISALIPVGPEVLELCANSTNVDKQVVNSVSIAEISVGDILMSFNLESVTEMFTRALVEERGVDPLSANNLRLCVNAALNSIMTELDYPTLREAFNLRRARNEEAVKEADVVSE